MNPSAHRNLARGAGVLLGVGLAAFLLLSSRPGAAGSPLAATVRVAVAPTGELEISPAPPQPALVAPSLRPGGERAAGGFGLRNQTGSGLAVALKAEANSSALNGLLRVRVGVGGRQVADTTLEGLRRRPLRLRLDSGQGTHLRLEAWLPKDVLGGYEGRLVTVSLVPKATRLGGGR
ncbi:MAG: hypothetical protein AB7V58_13260 [Solirubrobacterales bacterium]